MPRRRINPRKNKTHKIKIEKIKTLAEVVLRSALMPPLGRAHPSKGVYARAKRRVVKKDDD